MCFGSLRGFISPLRPGFYSLPSTPTLILARSAIGFLDLNGDGSIAKSGMETRPAEIAASTYYVLNPATEPNYKAPQSSTQSTVRSSISLTS
ncbi:hypothetical protein M0R45_011242 [Rubus argutus]|uniref:Uncharacterized protein n=1 Tax=Rubus argutus TaxID=59490 RepID=A0AAW1Y9J6_RUBAR